MTSHFRRFLLAPLTTILLILFAYIAGRFGYSTTLALPFAALSLATWYGGLRANLASAFIISLYAFLFYDPFRFVSVAFAAFAIAGASGMLKRSLREKIIEAEVQRIRAEHNQAKAEAYDNLNGNIDTLKRLARRISDLTGGWGLLNEQAKMAILEEVQGGLVNLAQKVIGWHEIAKEKKDFLKND